MRIIFFHQHFNTPQGAGGLRHYKMAKQLVARGHHVIVVCGSYQGGSSGLNNRFKKNIRIGEIEGIKIIEFNIPYSNYDNAYRRMIKFLIYAFKSTKLVFTEKYDLIFASSTPLTAAIPGIFAKKFLKKKFILEIRDLWPELLIKIGVLKNPIVIFFL